MHDTPGHIVVHPLPPSGERPPLFIIGDVHGCASELEALLKLGLSRVPGALPVLVGDLFTKGPDPVRVYELIQEYKALCIKGNHDWALISSIIQAQRKGISSVAEHTQQTLHMIRYHKRAIYDFLTHLPHAIKSTIKPQVKRRGWESEWGITIVHAGIDCTRSVESTPERWLLTARHVRWEAHSEEPRLVLVHSTSRMEAGLTGAHPPCVDPNQPQKFRWHQLHTGPDLLVFGHDAKQGLFRKTLPNQRPICVGIDTGCTYGRSLTGYFPEFDDAIQVPSARTYFDLARNLINLRSAQYMPSPHD